LKAFRLRPINIFIGVKDMAKIIEFMGPLGVGKTALHIEMKRIYNGSDVYGFPPKDGLWKLHAEELYRYISDNNNHKYIITESVFLVVMMEQLRLKVKHDKYNLNRLKRLKVNSAAGAAGRYPNVYIVFNLYTDIDTIVMRSFKRSKIHLDKKVVTILLDFYAKIAEGARKSNILVYDIDTTKPIQTTTALVRQLMEYHQDHSFSYYT